MHAIRAAAVLALALVLAGAPERAAADRSRVAAGAPAQSIGGYSAGCVEGAAELPRRGPGYERLGDEERAFGHPELVDFIRDLGRRTRRAAGGALLVADLGLERGGPLPSGHASHQSGLDVDIWYRRSGGRLSARKKAALRPRPMVDLRRQRVTRHWRPAMASVLRAASLDPRVARIFVNPVIKRALCEAGPAPWLAKLRPWYGHHEHFHVRLACPADSRECEDQPPSASGDGCAELAWWFDKEAQAARAKRRVSYRAKIAAAPALPPRCTALLAGD